MQCCFTQTESADSVLLSGVMAALSSLFKHAKRDDVVGMAPAVLAGLSGSGLACSLNAQLRKSHVKLVQWLGVVFLPPRLAVWRYHRGGRSLEDTLTSAVPTQHTTPYKVMVSCLGKWQLCYHGVCVCKHMIH